MKGLLLIPAVLAVTMLTGCGSFAGLREDLGIFDGHHREIKHRLDKAEDNVAELDARVSAAQDATAQAQADADAARAEAEAARRLAEKALHKYSKK